MTVVGGAESVSDNLTRAVDPRKKWRVWVVVQLLLLLLQPTATTYCNNLLQQPTTTTYYNYYEKGWVGRAGAGRRGSGAGIPGGGGLSDCVRKSHFDYETGSEICASIMKLCLKIAF